MEKLLGVVFRIDPANEGRRRTPSPVVPAKAGTHTPQQEFGDVNGVKERAWQHINAWQRTPGLWVPAFAGSGR